MALIKAVGPETTDVSFRSFRMIDDNLNLVVGP